MSNPAGLNLLTRAREYRSRAQAGYGLAIVCPSVKRLEATKRIEALLGRLARGEGRYVPRVREVWIFGSYARGAT